MVLAWFQNGAGMVLEWCWNGVSDLNMSLVHA
jgi:hypothetical protein